MRTEDYRIRWIYGQNCLIVIDLDDREICELPSVTNAIFSFKWSDRVRRIYIYDVPYYSLLEELATTSEPFPVLIELALTSLEEDSDPPIPLDSFLGGPGPVPPQLCSIPIPAVGKLLLSTRNLVSLFLQLADDSGYISPETMVTILSVLTRLKSLCIFLLNVESPGPRGESTSALPYPTRVFLPALTYFYYHSYR